MDLEWAYLRNLFDKATEVAVLAIAEFTELDNNEDLVEALFRAFVIAANQVELGYSREEAKARAQRFASGIDEALKRARTNRGQALAKLAASRDALIFEGDYSKAIASAEEALSMAEKAGDTYFHFSTSCHFVHPRFGSS